MFNCSSFTLQVLNNMVGYRWCSSCLSFIRMLELVFLRGLSICTIFIMKMCSKFLIGMIDDRSVQTLCYRILTYYYRLNVSKPEGYYFTFYFLSSLPSHVDGCKTLCCIVIHQQIVALRPLEWFIVHNIPVLNFFHLSVTCLQLRGRLRFCAINPFRPKASGKTPSNRSLNPATSLDALLSDCNVFLHPATG